MEQRKANIIYSKAGGNAGKGSYNTKVSIPKSWADRMGFSIEDRSAILEFDDETITIRKGEEDEE